MNRQLIESVSSIIVAVINEEEYQIKDFSASGITIVCSGGLEAVVYLKIYVFDIDQYEYVEFSFSNCSVNKIASNKYSNQYFLNLKNEQEQLQKVHDLYHYGESGVNKRAAKVPVKSSAVKSSFSYNNNVQDEYNRWYNFADKEANYEEFYKLSSDAELAIAINNSRIYGKLKDANLEDVTRLIIEENKIDDIGLFENNFSRVYLGNEFCPNLFPSAKLLAELFEKLCDQKVNITIVFPYIKEYYLDQFIGYLNQLKELCEENQVKIEIVINDFGLLEYIGKNYNCFSIVLGRLLNRRKKDPRISDQFGSNSIYKRYQKNYLDHDFFINYLKGIGIERIEYESYLYESEVSSIKNSLHFPFYQITTSAYCSLYAECNHVHPDSQFLIEKCPKYCSEFSQLYQEDLNVIGRGNTVFGYNKSVFDRSEYLKRYLKKGIDRLVLDIP